MDESEMEDDRYLCGLHTKSRREALVLIFISPGILVRVVLVIVVVMVFLRKRSLSVTKLECLGVGIGLVQGSIFGLGGNFVAVVLEVGLVDLELVMKAVVRVVKDCKSGRTYFLYCLNLMLVEGKMSDVGGYPLGTSSYYVRT